MACLAVGLADLGRGSRGALAVAFLLALGACATGPGNSDYQGYLAQREAALQGGAPAPGAVTPPQPYGGALPLSTGGTIYMEPLDAAGQPAAAGGRGYGPAPTTGTGAPLNAVGLGAAAPAPATGQGHAAISDEMDFDAVASRESIESDRMRIEANRAAYVQVAPQPLPQRGAAAGPNLAAYALSAPNRPGESRYSRGGLRLSSHERACAGFASPDLAQIRFLERGGPERDPGNLDPDGDGFACSWDPRPYQMARS